MKDALLSSAYLGLTNSGIWPPAARGEVNRAPRRGYGRATERQTGLAHGIGIARHLDDELVGVAGVRRQPTLGRHIAAAVAGAEHRVELVVLDVERHDPAVLVG
jgi:hypothetical protein